MKDTEGDVNTVSKINYAERDVLEQQRATLLGQLKELQFQLFDKTAPEVVEHVNQLQLEKAKQESLLKHAQSKLAQLVPELENFEAGAEQILLEAISQQDWYGFKNKREIVFDKRNGFLFPNFEYMPHVSWGDWEKQKKEYAPNGIGRKQWDVLTNYFKFNSEQENITGYKSQSDFNFPIKFAGQQLVSIEVYTNARLSYSTQGIINFKKNAEKFEFSGVKNHSNWVIFPALKFFNNPEVTIDNPRLTNLEKAKTILDFFIQQDWVPNFEPFLEKFHNEDEDDFQERLNEAQQQCDEYNKIFDAYYKRIQLQKKLVGLESQIAELPESAPINVFTSDYDYRIDLNNYNLSAIQSSVWQYSQASQQWICNLLNNLDVWENEHLDLVKNTVELNQELDKKLPVSINVTTEEKQLLESQLQQIKKRLDLGLTPLRSNLINLLSESQQISSNLEQTNTLFGLAQLEQQVRPSFELLTEHTAILCTKTLKEMEWLDGSLDFVKTIVSVLRKSIEDYLILVDKYQQDLVQIGLDNSIEIEEITKWFAEWRSERLSLLKQILPLLDAGLNKVIDENTVLDVLPCIEQYRTELDQFYLQKRLGIHTTYAFQPNGHRQEKLEKEQEHTKLVHQFMQQLEKVIFNTKTTAQKIWLIRFSEVWQQGVVNEITDFLAKEQLIERDDVIQIMSEELRKVQQQNLATCLQDAQSYSEALAQREKDVNILIFKMRKALIK
ncbi:hypothetical protein [Acinetobacter towneri]|uniref:hypothetical protein n=1 Tax=Acinetobacter towneri TaxID=202956 RepID=UPI002935751E|nr:hypothetical protein [Acinetobacter towneri]MDV2484716.1 hypothetical protein [Acinetobacter towneri]